jgi:phage tail-like protein
MPPTFREDPYGAYNFVVTITGVADDGATVKAGCSEVSGLEVEVTPIDYRTGNEPPRHRKYCGLQKYMNITLKRGMTGDIAMWNWIRNAMKGQVLRAQGSIVMHDEAHRPVLRWNFTRGWPCKYTGPGYNAANSETAFETVEIAHEGLSIDGQI